MYIPKSIIKRPLGFTCLGAALLLFLAVRVSGDSAPGQDAEGRGLSTAGDDDCTDTESTYEVWEGQRVTITGRVCKKETVRQDKGPTEVIYLELAENNGGAAPDAVPPGQKALCYLSSGQSPPELGSTVRISGKLRSFEKASNPGQFDAYSYYQISGISYRLNQAEILAKTVKYNRAMETLYHFREFLSGKLAEGLPEKEASVMQTMLLGKKEGMEKELKALYQRNGIAHILAISGLHVSLLGMGLYRILRRCAVPMKAAAAVSWVLVILYGAMTGFSVSSVRAVFMFSLQMLGVCLERTYDMITAAALAAALILIKQPLYYNHSGFWFSFGCVLGISLFLPMLTRGKKEMHPLVKGLLSGIAMTTVTLPLYLWFYYQFPVYSVFLNFLVIPLMSLLMAAGLLFLVCQILFPQSAVPVSFFIKGVLIIYEKSCEVCEDMPGHLFTPGRPQVWQMAAYLLLLVLLLILKKKAGLLARWGIVCAGIIILIIRPAKDFELTFLDVGQGDCIYIENGKESRYLIDGGSSSVSSVGEYRIIPFLKFKGAFRLDAVFVTHPDEDHCNGIKELLAEGKQQGIEVDRLVLPDVSKELREEGYLELVEAAKESDIPVSYISRGQMIKSGKLTLMCLHPESGETLREPNEYSIVLGLAYRDFTAMLTGDVEGGGERKLIRYLQENMAFQDEDSREFSVNVLKAAHHGSKNSTGEDFLAVVQPRFAVISAGKNNRYGHPHVQLLGRLKERGCVIYETSKSGAVTVRVKQNQMKVTRFCS